MRRSLFAACLIAGAAALSLSSAHAAPLSSAPEAVSPAQSMIEDVQYRPFRDRGRVLSRCQRARIQCASNYPARGWRYRRCLAARGCF